MRTSYLLVATLAVATGAACGEVSGFIDAAPGDDDTIDASTVDAEPELGAVNVVTHARCCTGPSGPIGGIEIFVVHPDGTLGDTATSDGNGEATVDVLPGSWVTAVYERDPGASLVTYAAVEPGDTLTFGGGPFVDYSTQTQTASVTINWPAQSGISYFYVVGACSTWYVGGTATTFTEPIYNTCPAGPTTYYLLAFDTAYQIVRYGEVPNVPHTDGTVTVPSFQSATSYSFNATGIPSEINYAYLSVEGYIGNRYLGGYGSGGSFSGGSASLTTGMLTGEIDSVSTSIEFGRPGGYNSQYHVERTAGATPRTYANPRMLPWLSPIVVSLVTRELLWLAAGTEPYDATTLQIYWSRGSGGSAVWGGGGSEYYDWYMIMPPGVTRVALPPAPASIEPYLPTADDYVDAYVQITDSAGVDGYRQVVAIPEWESYYLGPWATPMPLTRRSSAYGNSSGGGGKGRVLLPRHGLPNQFQPPRHR